MNFLTNLNLNYNELQNALIHPLSVAPVTAKQGQLYFNTAQNILFQYNGAEWTPVGVVYSQPNDTGIVITGLGSNGSIDTTNVVDLTLTGYSPVLGGYISNNDTLQTAFAALDTAVQNAVAGGGEVNQNAFSSIQLNQQSENDSSEVEGNTAPVTISATSKTDTFNFNSGDKWIQVLGDGSGKIITVGHAFSGVTPETYGNATNSVQITVDNAGHVTGISNQPIVGAQYITGLTSDAQTQLNNKISMGLMGEPNGVATLGGDGLIPTTQLPSYVDDVVETYVVGDVPYANNWLSTTQEGESLTPQTGIIYIVVGEGEYQNDQYRWGGTQYVLCNPSDVNSVNGKTGVVVLTQDDIGDGTNYVQFSNANKTKLEGIETNATENNIQLNGASAQNPNFYAPTDSGNVGQILISNGSNNAPTWQNMPATIKKFSQTNGDIAAQGGAFVWTIAGATHNLGNADLMVSVYEVSTGDKVLTEVNINSSTYDVTITINDVNTISNLTVGTYKAVIIG